MSCNCKKPHHSHGHHMYGHQQTHGQYMLSGQFQGFGHHPQGQLYFGPGQNVFGQNSHGYIQQTGYDMSHGQQHHHAHHGHGQHHHGHDHHGHGHHHGHKHHAEKGKHGHHSGQQFGDLDDHGYGGHEKHEHHHGQHNMYGHDMGMHHHMMPHFQGNMHHQPFGMQGMPYGGAMMHPYYPYGMMQPQMAPFGGMPSGHFGSQQQMNFSNPSMMRGDESGYFYEAGYGYVPHEGQFLPEEFEEGYDRDGSYDGHDSGMDYEQNPLDEMRGLQQDSYMPIDDDEY